MSKVPVLSTDRLRLRAHRRDGLDCVHALWSDPGIVRYIGGKPSTRSESWSRLLRYLGHWSVMQFGYRFVEDRTTGEFLGEVGLANFYRDVKPSLGNVPKIGWVLAPSSWGRGWGVKP